MNYTGQADALSARADIMLRQGSQANQRNLALEISSFLQSYGGDLDAQGGGPTVDKLSMQAGQLASAGGPVEQISPVLTGVMSFIGDNASLDNALGKNVDEAIQGVKDKLKKAAPKPPLGDSWVPWILGGVGLVILIGVGYTVRAFK